jgi:hypothetical protein
MTTTATKLDLTRNDLGCIRDWVKEIFDISLPDDQILKVLNEVPEYDGATNDEGECQLTILLCNRFYNSKEQLQKFLNQSDRTENKS